MKVYGFECTCDRCCLPTTSTIAASPPILEAPFTRPGELIEPFRLFKCPRGCCEGSGVVCVVYVDGVSSEKTEADGYILPAPTPTGDEGSDVEDEDGDADDGCDEAESEGNNEEGDRSSSPGPLVGLVCRSCGWRASADEVCLAMALEDNLCDITPDSFEALEEWKAAFNQGVYFATDDDDDVDNNDGSSLTQVVMHDGHYLLFWLEDDLAMALAEDVQQLGPGLEKKNALLKCCAVMKSLISRLDCNEAVPRYHSEKAIYWDRLAQLFISAADCVQTHKSAGDCENVVDEREDILKEARDAFAGAYEMSRKCAGERGSNTQQLKELLDDMPTSVKDLATRYSRVI